MRAYGINVTLKIFLKTNRNKHGSCVISFAHIGDEGDAVLKWVQAPKNVSRHSKLLGNSNHMLFHFQRIRNEGINVFTFTLLIPGDSLVRGWPGVSKVT